MMTQNEGGKGLLVGNLKIEGRKQNWAGKAFRS